MEKLEIGQVVKSNSGRDKNNLYIVTNVLKNGYVELVDGKYRKIKNPKRKNARHLEILKHVAGIQIDLNAKDSNNQNAIVQKILKRLGNEMEEMLHV